MVDHIHVYADTKNMDDTYLTVKVLDKLIVELDNKAKKKGNTGYSTESFCYSDRQPAIYCYLNPENNVDLSDLMC